MANILGVGSISGVIYKAENIVNGKVYIGQTTKSLRHRKNAHLATSRLDSGLKRNSLFMRAIRKYGTHNFKWEIIDSSNNHFELSSKEIFWIGYYEANNPSKGYNMTEGGEGTVGFTHKEETKDFISKLNTGRAKTEEWRQKHSKNMTGVNNPRTELDEKSVVNIKKLIINNRSNKEIATELGVSKYAVSRIRTGKTFSEIEVEGFTPKKSKRKTKKYLTSEQVIEILLLLIDDKYTLKEIGNVYGVGKHVVYQVKVRKTYSDVDIPDEIIEKYGKFMKAKGFKKENDVWIA